MIVRMVGSWKVVVVVAESEGGILVPGIVENATTWM
jgi:hypothetical protein